VLLGVTYAALCLLPDGTVSTSTGYAVLTVTATAPPGGGPVIGFASGGIMVAEVPGTGLTIPPIGRILQAACMIGILLIMMSIGSAQYEIWGIPYDYVYLEKQSIAIEADLDYWLENEKEIRNDFVGTHDQADTVAVTELIWERVMGNPRKIIMKDDPSLELGDILYLPDGRKVVVTGLAKKIKFGEATALEVTCAKVMVA
jgi:hypothetical protein